MRPAAAPLQEGSVVPAPDPRPLRTHNLIILWRNMGFPLGRVWVTPSSCSAGGGGRQASMQGTLGDMEEAGGGPGLSCLPV